MRNQTRVIDPVVCTLSICLLFLPGIAHAQHIPLSFVVAALSPLLVIVFAVILGVVSRSWRVGTVHAGLVLTWVLLFGFAAYFIENDYVIWTPLVLYAVHAVIIVALIVKGVVQRVGSFGRAG